MDSFWRCESCKKTVELNLDGEFSRCADCGSPRVMLIQPRREEKTKLPQSLLERLFAEMHKALNL
jgi:DNA-directed RNA polymerase subunit RPC12/RpoP